MPQIFRSLFFDIKYLFEELWLLVKHPTRKATFADIRHHWCNIWDTLIFHPWYCLKRGINNVWNWGWQIWSLDSWDMRYMQDLVFKQLSEMEKLWREVYVPREREWAKEGGQSQGYRCQQRRIWKQIRWAKTLLQMHFDEHYAMKWYDIHHAKFPTRGLLEHIESETKYDEYGIPILYTCTPMSEEEHDHYRSGSDNAHNMDKKVWNLYCKVMGKQNYWWD